MVVPGFPPKSYYVHRWAETPVGRHKERETGRGEGGRRFID